MAHILPFEDKEPEVHPGAFVAPTAVLIGDVRVEEGASVWFGAVLRGDFNRIVVGAGTSVQDNCVIHTNEDLPTTIGSNVTVGHLSLLEGCEIGDGALIGMGSIVLNRARVGRRAMLAAGSVVKEGGEVPDEVLAAGVPALVKKSLEGSSSEWVEMAAREYQALRLKYMGKVGQLANDGEGGA
ncbi:MAG TPA: gamma carbonic anhydrase family protein [Rubrobacteraceae bacterium]|nr:gamma carbonic anhydrase family protein [Rubrobacteraceae bacterium]